MKKEGFRFISVFGTHMDARVVGSRLSTRNISISMTASIEAIAELELLLPEKSSPRLLPST